MKGYIIDNSGAATELPEFLSWEPQTELCEVGVHFRPYWVDKSAALVFLEQLRKALERVIRIGSDKLPRAADYLVLKSEILHDVARKRQLVAVQRASVFDLEHTRIVRPHEISILHWCKHSFPS